jgi:hypothetical protein
MSYRRYRGNGYPCCASCQRDRRALAIARTTWRMARGEFRAALVPARERQLTRMARAWRAQEFVTHTRSHGPVGREGGLRSHVQAALPQQLRIGKTVVARSQ